MDRDPSDYEMFDGLRRTVVSEPKVARAELANILVNSPKQLDAILDLASRPGENRMRQMIATTFRLNPDERLRPWLSRWLSVEADEFTKSAIKDALGEAQPSKTAMKRKTLSNNLIEAYRYVSDRLCHRVRNTLTLPGAQFLRLQNCIDEANDPSLQQELSEILASLRLSYQRLAKAVEFDTGDGYLEWTEFNIVDWVERSASEFRSRFGDASISLQVAARAKESRVIATKFLLDTMFGNLWSNAVQAAPSPCKLTFACSINVRKKTFQIVVYDNGAGFSKDDREMAFHQAFSTKSTSRGRGLLEIGDAVVQLQGAIDIAEVSPGEFRIRIELPARIS